MLQAAELGLWGVARLLYESGLEHCPQHVLMLQKLAEALASANDWPAAQDCLHQLSKTGMLSKQSKQLFRLVSEESDGHVHDSDADYSAGSFKRRRINLKDSDPSVTVPAQLKLPSSDWPNLLDALSRHLESHFAGSSTPTYTVSLEQHTCAASNCAFPDDPQRTHDKIDQQHLSQTTITAHEQESEHRPQSAGSAALGGGDALTIASDEPSSQDCAERVSKRIAMRRSGLSHLLHDQLLDRQQ